MPAPEIETLDDWNDRLACCCGMPVCPVPVIRRREARASVVSMGFNRLFIDRQPSDPFVLSEWQNALDYIRTRTRPAPATSGGSLSKTEYSAGPTTTFTQTEQNGHYTFSRVLCPDDEIASDVVQAYGGSGTYVSTFFTRPTTSDPWELQSTNTVTVSAPADPEINTYLATGFLDYADPGTPDEPYAIGPFTWTGTISPWSPVETESLGSIVDWATWLSGAIALLVPPTDLGCFTTSSVGNASTLAVTPPASWSGDGTVQATWNYFRFQIPDNFEGSYFLFTWDIAEFLADDPDTPVLVAADETSEWIGPGDPEDPDSWLTPWQLLPLPSAPGQVRVVNLRYQCYRETPYGTPPPTVLGEGVDWPDP